MIKAFLFDYDGVITAGVPDRTASGRLAKNLNISKDTAAEWLSDIIPELLTGKMTDSQAHTLLEEKYGQPISSEQGDIWFKWPELMPLPEMTKLLQSLKARGYVLGLISNASASTKAEIMQHDGYAGFDFTVLSCDAGYKKPGLEIFQVALQNLPGIKPEEVVFLDDREAATLAAAQLGMQTIYVVDHQQAIRTVEDQLIYQSHLICYF